MKKKHLFFAFKLLVSILLMGFVVYKIDISDPTIRLTNIDPKLLILALFTLLCQILNNSIRWQIVMRGIQVTLPFFKTFQLFYVGIFFNATLPSSAGGDVVRMVLVHKQGISLRGAINGVMLERVVTLLGVIFLIVFTQSLLLDRIDDFSLNFVIPVIGMAAVVGIIILMLLDRIPGRLRRWRLVRGMIYLASDAKQLFLSPVHAATTIGLGVTGNMLLALTTYFLALSLDIQIGFIDCLVLIPLVILLTIIPISIGGWGLREGVMVTLFAFVGVANSDAFFMSILLGLMNFVISLPGGIIWLMSGYNRTEVANLAPTT